jgi:hypothetical protein
MVLSNPQNTEVKYMSTKKVKTYTCKACGKTSEKIGVTSFCRQTLTLASDDWSSPEVGETLHGFCLDCCAEVPENIMKKFLKGGEITVDHQSLLIDPLPLGASQHDLDINVRNDFAVVSAEDLAKNAKVLVHGIKGYDAFDGRATVSLKALNKARVALGYKAL